MRRWLTYPNVKRKSAVLKGLGCARHRQDFMDRVTGEEYCRVVVRIEKINSSPSVIQSEITASELSRVLMKVIDARQPSLPIRTTRIDIAVLPKRRLIVVRLSEQLEPRLPQIGSESDPQCWNEVLKAF